MVPLSRRSEWWRRSARDGRRRSLPSGRLPTSAGWATLRVVLVAALFLGGGTRLAEWGQGALAGLDGPGRAPLPAAEVATVPLLPPVPAPPPSVVPPAVDTGGLPPQSDRPIVIPANPYANETVVQIGTIEIPRIGLTHPIFHGVTLRNIDHGPAHWPGTPYPGQAGNAVFAGHRITHSHPFRNLDRLVAGDQVIFTVKGVRSVYAVTGSEVVTPSALHIADPTPEPTATLYACHPPGSARYRYVVHLALAGGPV